MLEAHEAKMIPRMDLYQTHMQYLSKPATLTHVSNPVFVPPTLDQFLKSIKPVENGKQKDSGPSFGRDSEQIDINFE